MLHVLCPTCGNEFDIDDAKLDSSIACNRCMLMFSVKPNVAPQRAANASAKPTLEEESPATNVSAVRLVIGAGLLLLFVCGSLYILRWNPTFLLIALLIVGAIAFAVFAVIAEQQRIARMPPHEREAYLEKQRETLLSLQWGPINPAMVCPHCKQKGNIRTKPVVRKKGISGGKATGALLTGGVSLLATGLSRKEGPGTLLRL